MNLVFKKATIGVFLFVVFLIPQYSFAQEEVVDKSISDYVDSSLDFVGNNTPPKIQNFFTEVLEPSRVSILEKIEKEETNIENKLKEDLGMEATSLQKTEKVIRNIIRILLLVVVFVFSAQILFYPVVLFVLFNFIKLLYKIIHRLFRKKEYEEYYD